MYYQVTGESQNSYARLVFLNELVSGQDIDYIDNLFLREDEHPLRFDQKNCYICLLGLKKAVYSGRYSLTTNQYMQIYVSFEHKISSYFQKHGFKGETFLHLYADKQIVIIFSKTEESDLLPIQIAQYAQDCLQLLYCENFLFDDMFCNQTYFNEEGITRQQLSVTLKNLIDLSKFNFFYMKTVVISTSQIKGLQKIFNETDIRELRHKIIDSINSSEFVECKSALEELMLLKVKYSFDFYLLQDIGFFFKNFYLEFCIAYGITLEENVDFLFDYRSYEKIETFTESLLNKFEKIINFINLKEKKYNQLIQKSLRILNTSFHKPDITAKYIASQVNVSPSYLSSVFNSEVEMSISQYLTKLRIEKAKKMLEETSMRINDISLSVGYYNKRYFTQVFKQKVGCTPKEYRDTIIR